MLFVGSGHTFAEIAALGKDRQILPHFALPVSIRATTHLLGQEVDSNNLYAVCWLGSHVRRDRRARQGPPDLAALRAACEHSCHDASARPRSALEQSICCLLARVTRSPRSPRSARTARSCRTSRCL